MSYDNQQWQPPPMGGGYPPPPGPSGYGPPAPALGGNGLSTAALITGICAVGFPILGYILLSTVSSPYDMGLIKFGTILCGSDSHQFGDSICFSCGSESCAQGQRDSGIMFRHSSLCRAGDFDDERQRAGSLWKTVLRRAFHGLSGKKCTMVAPKPPATGGASVHWETKGVRAKTLRTISRCTPLPLP